MIFAVRQRTILLTFLLLLGSVQEIFAGEQKSTDDGDARPSRAESGERRATTEKNFIRNVLLDQKTLWTAPLRMKPADGQWLAPLAFVTAGLLVTDSDSLSELESRPSFRRNSDRLSNLGLAAIVGGAGAFYVSGLASGNQHQRETGLLAGEAALNGLLVSGALKYAMGRERPNEDAGEGRFWKAGKSFPSGHAMVSWSVATVVAHEYPGTLTKFLAYGAASAVSASRVTAREHFLSDALVGSTLGYLIGRHVYRTRHNPELPGAEWGTFVKEDDAPQPGRHASPFVPMDSWVYPALERLAALGFVKTGFAGIRPWSRAECARMVEEAADALVEASSVHGEATVLVRALQENFDKELGPDPGRSSVEVDSIYTRVTGISGTPLRDGYHFAQTIANDFGRPYSEGFNIATGASVRASAGPVMLYARGEFQHAPGAGGYSEEVQRAIAGIDGTPGAFDLSSGEINRGRLLEAYAGWNVAGFQFTFGNQSLWWGPNRTGPFLFSTNSEPIPMLRIVREEPVRVPLLSSFLGPIRTEFFIGQMDGHRYIRTPNRGPTIDPEPFDSQPMLHGQKVSFRPTENFEFSVSRTAIFGGERYPVTWRSFYRSMFANHNSRRLDPGDRRSGFDLVYRVPKLRKWLTIYTDAYVEDELSPLGYFRRSAWSPGFYMPAIPGIPKLDFRAEGIWTDLPGLHDAGVFYANTQYRSGYTHLGQIIGSWVGRQGSGFQAWSTYWLNARNTLQASYRKQRVNRDFLQGGKLHDVSFTGDFLVSPRVAISAGVQYERWYFPLLSATRQSNVTSSVKIELFPTAKKKRD